MASDCIFCSIVAGQVDCELLYHDQEVTAFQDSRPAAPVHVLIVPNRHIASVNQLEQADAALLGRMTLVARQMAVEKGVDQSGYRLVVNTGPDSGQSVFHLHMHLLGGRHLGVRPV
jgi:histidine triad (HIT) family protein